MGRCGCFRITPFLPSLTGSTVRSIGPQIVLFANLIEKKRGYRDLGPGRKHLLQSPHSHVLGAWVPGTVMGCPDTLGCTYALNTQDGQEGRHSKLEKRRKEPELSL